MSSYIKCKFIDKLSGISADPKAVKVNSKNEILNNFHHMNLLQYTAILNIIISYFISFVHFCGLRLLKKRLVTYSSLVGRPPEFYKSPPAPGNFQSMWKV